MTDPYKVLNIPSTATDEEVKKAYRELARKYHPDNYHDNPLADLAQEKMKEINEAYDTITKMRGTGHGGSGSVNSSGSYGSASYGGYRGGYDGGAAFRQVRAAINRNDLNMAEHVLNIISEHNGEWYFLKGVLCYRRGWMDEALRCYETACRLSPENMEYRQALERMRNAGQAYRPAGYEVFTTNCGDGNICGRLACAWCLCNACGCGGIQFF